MRPSSATRQRDALGTIGAIVSLVLLLAVFLFAGGAAYLAYLAVPDIPELPAAPSPLATAPRPVVMFIIDGFNPERAFDPSVMPTFTRLAEGGASGIARTSSMSLTTPCVFSLATGRPGTLLQGILDFHAQETRVDSLPRSMAEAGRRVILAGEESWSRQFGWTARAEDRQVAPPTGVTIDDRIRHLDRDSTNFLIGRLRERSYGLGVIHVTSVDAVGHMVTPSGPEYVATLHFADGLLAEVVAAAAPDSVFLVTGDHGMGPRGTHSGRDDEASFTPYVLHGPGVRTGVKQNVPQTGLAPTLAVLAGLPLLQATEHPPLTALLTLDAGSARTVEAEYAKRKVAVTKLLAPLTMLDPADADVNERANRVLFDTNDGRTSRRLLAAAAATVGVLLALLLAWRSAPWRPRATLLLPNLLVALIAPFSIAAVSLAFIAWRSLFPYESAATAKVLAVLIFAATGVIAALGYRSPRVRELFTRWPLALFFTAMVVVSAPLVNSGWFAPDPYFKGLLVLIGLGFLVMRPGSLRSRPVVAVLPVGVVVLLASGSGAPSGSWPAWTYLLPLSVVVLGVAMRNAWSSPRSGLGAGMILLAAFSVAWVWKVSGGPALASAVLLCSVIALAAPWWLSCDAVGAAALLIGGASALSLMMAESPHESAVFLLAALGALVLSRARLILDSGRALYLAAGVAVLLRLCLYFELGDYYSISSIRTAPGFRIVAVGQPLATVVTMLVLKYALPWVIILASVLPSFTEAGTRAARHTVQLLALGYVARFAVIAAVIDAFRVLPAGMSGIIGLFAISWAELVTLLLAALIFLPIMDRVAGRGTYRAVTARSVGALQEVPGVAATPPEFA